MTSPAPRVVTALEPDPRKPGVVRVHVDGRPYCAVPAAALGRAEVAEGSTLSPERLDLLGELADEEGAFRTLLRALERRAYARADLGRRLVRKGHRAAAVEAALERAAGLGLLDDAAYARNYVDTRSARGRGPARLLRDLLAMGVERRHIDVAIAERWPPGADRAAMPKDLAVRRSRQLGALPRETKRRRLVAYLARRGFTGPEVRQAVQEALATPS
jgi:regulatory protein